MSVGSGLYRITTRLSPNPAVGVDPRNDSAIKPVIVVPSAFSSEATTWRVTQEDGQLYLLSVDSANTRPDQQKVCAYYGEPGERWKIVHHPLRRGYTILNPDESLAWYLPNSEDFTQVVLRRLGIIPGEGYYFNLEPLIDD
ncbi:hypothetical protein EDD16DRAFT_1518202 [Pisolithus croceorrhizus]|nr:hypothetical protein EV401DRAFT_2071018 [Pisolithus croceorrhizus]KAI6122886.1 hypothetical protein EDD16DRAFT_1518202 [Pisolithus croceorrhizus]KAI6168993.1 hypothetical protein EDD17DRAFT_1892264 [Pisolithus thermaeus]